MSRDHRSNSASREGILLFPLLTLISVVVIVLTPPSFFIQVQPESIRRFQVDMTIIWPPPSSSDSASSEPVADITSEIVKKIEDLKISSASLQSLQLGRWLQSHFAFVKTSFTALTGAPNPEWRKDLQPTLDTFSDWVTDRLESHKEGTLDAHGKEVDHLIRSICYQSPGVLRKPNKLSEKELADAITNSENVLYFLLRYYDRELSRINHPLHRHLK